MEESLEADLTLVLQLAIVDTCICHILTLEKYSIIIEQVYLRITLVLDDLLWSFMLI